MEEERIIIYSVLPRLWGNLAGKNIHSGSLADNGSGKLSMWDDQALEYVKSLGCTHIWFVGLLEHATQEAYRGISADPKSIVKGVAGSPYAVKDYYDIAPSLADVVEQRIEEFDALVRRVHRAGLKLMMDFIPNHVARTYASDFAPKGTEDLGQGDDIRLGFSNQNNFYYFPGETLRLPDGEDYIERPAKATGNDCFCPTPSRSDWYETIKLNYGVDYLGGQAVFEPIPLTWYKMRDILVFWAERGVDGFRCDMVEMVPPEFWAWVLPELKSRYPLIFLAEIYQPNRYATYLEAGFDYLYDKVGVYDTLKGIVRGEVSADHFDPTRDAVGSHQAQMCYFLENHDEQRFMSPYFSGSYKAIRPALAVMALSGGQPYLHYFAGELAEPGIDSEGFSGKDGRTTIFDFWSMASLCRLGADLKGKALLPEERDCLEYHRKVLNLAGKHPVLSHGAYHGLNYLQGADYDGHRLLSFVRYHLGVVVLVVANFATEARCVSLRFTDELLERLGIGSNRLLWAKDLLTGVSRPTCISPWASWNLQLEGEGVCIIEFRPA